MTSDKNDILLLVQGQSPQADLDAVLDDLKTLQLLDLYTLRMRLTGHAINMLHKGNRDDLEAMASLLIRHHIPHWIVTPFHALVEPQSPDTIRRVDDGFIFGVAGHNHHLTAASKPLIILADLTNQVAERIIKRSRVQYTYTGSVHTDQNNDDLSNEIFRHEPRILLAWGATTLAPEHFIDLSPTSIPAEILGKNSRTSRQWNFAEFFKMLCQLCPNHHLDTGFGLGFLPDYRVHPCDKTDLVKRRENTTALIRYANLLLDMAQYSQMHHHAKSGAADQTSAAVVAFATAFQNPLQASVQSHSTPKKTLRTPRPSLPTPPAPTVQSGLSLHFNGWRLLTNLGAIAVFFFVEVNHRAAGDFYRYGFSTGFAPLVVSALCFWNGLFFWRLRQRIINTATSKARSAAMGMVEVYGKTRRQYALVSPTTQQPCVYYCLKRYRRNHKDQWKLSSVTTSDSVPFTLEDDTGSITIDPRGALLKLETSHNDSGLTAADEKWEEQVIYENSMVYVLGFASTSQKYHGSLRERVAEKLRHLKSDRDTLMRYDHDGDGQISSHEWDNARTVMEQEVLHEKLQQGQQRSNEQLVIGAPPSKDLPFIIAATPSEEHLVRHYSWQIPLLLVGGLITFIWAIEACVSYFHLV